MKYLSRRELTPKRAAIVACVLALLIGVDAGVREYQLIDSIVNICAGMLNQGTTISQLPSFCFGDTTLVAAIKVGAIASVVYFLIIFGVLMIARLVWRAIIGRRRGATDRATRS